MVRAWLLWRRDARVTWTFLSCEHGFHCSGFMGVLIGQVDCLATGCYGNMRIHSMRAWVTWTCMCIPLDSLVTGTILSGGHGFACRTLVTWTFLIVRTLMLWHSRGAIAGNASRRDHAKYFSVSMEICNYACMDSSWVPLTRRNFVKEEL